MRHRRLGMALLMCAGSLFIYCGQAATNSGDAGFDGFVSDARAEENCGCTTGPSFTRLADVVLTQPTMTQSTLRSEPISVGSFREVIVYTALGSAPTGCTVTGDIGVKFRPDAATEFGYTGTVLNFGGRVRVDGTDMRLSINTNCTSYRMIVAGVH